MTVENDFLVWASGGGNVASQATYAAASQLANGYVSGVAPSNLFNKSFRQGTLMAAVIADFIVQQTGLPAIDDGTTATLLANFIAALGATTRIKLLATGNVYVDASTGNDSTGKGTLALPWQTIQHAANVIQANYDLAGQNMVINVAAGSLTAGLTLTGPITGASGPGSLLVQGAGSGSTTVAVSGANAFVGLFGAQFSVNGFTVTASGSSPNGCAVLSQSGSAITIGSDIIFGACATGHMVAQIDGFIGAGPYGISGSAPAHWLEAGGTISIQSGSIVLTGTPAFSTAFAYAQLGGLIEAVSPTFTGTATGSRYNASVNGVIWTNGAGSTYLPGNAGGTTATGGVYG